MILDQRTWRSSGLLSQRLKFSADAGTPIDDRAKDVKQEGSDLGLGHFGA